MDTGDWYFLWQSLCADEKKYPRLFSHTFHQKKGGGSHQSKSFLLTASTFFKITCTICNMFVVSAEKKLEVEANHIRNHTIQINNGLIKLAVQLEKKFTSLNVYIVKQSQMKPRTIYDLVVKYIRKPWIGVLKITMVVSQIKHSIVEIQKNIRI